MVGIGCNGWCNCVADGAGALSLHGLGDNWECADVAALLLQRSSYPIPKGMGLMIRHWFQPYRRHSPPAWLATVSHP